MVLTFLVRIALRVGDYAPLFCVLLLLLPGTAAAHPHGPDSAVFFSGTVRQVDVKSATLVVDGVDPRTFTRRDVLVFVDSRATIRAGKARLVLADIQVGQRVTLVGEREEDDAGKIVITDVRVNLRRR